MHELRTLLAPLRVLDAVHRAGSVHAAAERLHITPSAVSHQLRRLEAALAVPLVGKAGREIVFTETGRDLALRAADLFDGLENALAQAAGVDGRRPVRVKVIPSFAIQWLMPRLAGFYLRHQDIDVEIATVSRADDTDLHNADFVVRRGDGDWPDLAAERLFADELVVACAPEVAARIRAPRDLLREKLLKSIIAPDAWAQWLASAGMGTRARASKGPEPRFVPLANAALCLQAAVRGLGVVATQRAYMEQEFTAGHLVQPLPHVAASGLAYWLVHDRAKSRLAPCRPFLQWLRGCVQGPA